MGFEPDADYGHKREAAAVLLGVEHLADGVGMDIESDMAPVSHELVVDFGVDLQHKIALCYIHHSSILELDRNIDSGHTVVYCYSYSNCCNSHCKGIPHGKDVQLV